MSFLCSQLTDKDLFFPMLGGFFSKTKVPNALKSQILRQTAAAPNSLRMPVPTPRPCLGASRKKKPSSHFTHTDPGSRHTSPNDLENADLREQPVLLLHTPNTVSSVQIFPTRKHGELPKGHRLAGSF